MNLNLDKANKWMFELGVRTMNRNSGSLFVNREDVNCLETPKDFLNSLHSAVGNKKLFWNDAEEDMEWYVLESF